MRSTRFRSRPLPEELDAVVRARLAAAHVHQPFSPLDARRAARRTAVIVGEIGLTATLYRGGLDLRGVEVDHVWLAAAPREGADDDEAPPFVVDTAFPLFSERFVAALRHFVAGDGTREELAAAAEGSDVDERVVGIIPAPMRYLGAPVWSSRGGGRHL